jgi:hypothetical protein
MILMPMMFLRVSASPRLRGELKGDLRFTNRAGELTIESLVQGATQHMVVTGELIRMMNYVDDIAATLRRIQAGIPSMTEEERKRLAEYMRKADPSYVGMMTTLDKDKDKG